MTSAATVALIGLIGCAVAAVAVIVWTIGCEELERIFRGWGE